MEIDLSSLVLHPKGNPVGYFNRYQNPLGEDTIFVYYRDYVKKGNDFVSRSHISYKRKIEVKVNLSTGMLPGFYLRYFDYAVESNGEPNSLLYAYHDHNQMEFGIFSGMNNPWFRDLRETPEHLLIWTA
jgi:hypothetical protein